jgi:predicted RNA polymerase sigma factor
MGDAQRAVEAVARASYGRLVAYLSSETRDVAGAEDALGEALLAALTSWPRDGVPEQPEAWLLTAARGFWTRWTAMRWLLISLTGPCAPTFSGISAS